MQRSATGPPVAAVPNATKRAVFCQFSPSNALRTGTVLAPFPIHLGNKPSRCAPGHPPALFALRNITFFIQIPPPRCLFSDRIVNSNQQTQWCEALYQSKGNELVLYGRALGLSHGEAEDVLQETFIALMQRSAVPSQPEHYCV